MKRHERKHSWKYALWVSTASVLVLAGAAYAKTPLTATATGHIEGDYARLSFQWPERVRFSTKANGNRLTLTFDKPTNANVGGIMQSLRPIITKAEKSADGRSVTFTLDHAYKTRTFMSGNTAGVDLLGIKNKPHDAKPVDLGEKAVETVADEAPALKAKPAAAEKAKPKIKAEAKAPAVKAEAKVQAAKVERSVAPAAELVQSPIVQAQAPKKPNMPPPPPAPKAPEPVKAAAEQVTKTVQNITAEQSASAGSQNPALTPTVPVKEVVPPVAKTVMPSPVVAPTASTPVAAPLQAAVTPAPSQTPATTATAPAKTIALTPTASAPATAVSAVPAPVTSTAEKPKTETAAKPEVQSTAKPESKTAEVKPSAKTTPAQTAAAIPVAAKPPVDPFAPVKASVIPEGPTLHFPMTERVAAAVFSRGDVLWVVFNKPVPIDVNAIKLPDMLASVEKLPDDTAPGATILRFKQKGQVNPFVYKEAGSPDWNVVFAKRPMRPAERIRVSLSTEPPLKPHVILPVLETSEPISVKDPIIGDTIHITTVYKPGAGLTPERDYVEFTLLNTAQGVAVVPTNDTTRIVAQRNGLKITTADGVTLSPNLPRLAMDEQPDNSITGDATLFPYAQWKLKDENDFVKEEHRLIGQAAMGQGDNANFARLRLLQLLLAEGMFQESIGLADEIKARDPAFYTTEKVAALRGAANFLIYRLGDASADFASPELADVQEIDMWKNAIGDLSGDQLKTFDFLAYNDSFISKYPPAFRQKLAIIAGDLSINRKDYNAALKAFDSLNKDHILYPIQGYVDYMIGKISAETNQPDKAIDLWKQLAGNVKDNFLRARAEFSLVNLQLQQGKITRKEAIDRLDKLRIVWRGDGLELNLLLLLGNLYMDEKQYLEGLRTYRDVVTYFPNVPEALPTAQKMAETFRMLFNAGGADDMPPLKALSLFYEFRELTPIESEGDQMIRNLADRLISVDLLSRAAGLLDHQVRYRLQKEDRSRVGARLALVYLLNRQPKEALYTLELTGYGQNPVELQRTRNQLAAAALTATGEYDKALAVLEGDLSAAGQRARLGVYWGKKDWTNLVPVAESILSTRNDPTKPLDPNETDALLKLATAYAFERDAAQLKYLSDYFTPLMKNNLQERTFHFITKGSDPVDVKNMEQINQEITSIQDYLSSYRSQVAKGGLSSVVQ